MYMVLFQCFALEPSYYEVHSPRGVYVCIRHSHINVVP